MRYIWRGQKLCLFIHSDEKDFSSEMHGNITDKDSKEVDFQVQKYLQEFKNVD